MVPPALRDNLPTSYTGLCPISAEYSVGLRRFVEVPAGGGPTFGANGEQLRVGANEYRMPDVASVATSDARPTVRGTACAAPWASALASPTAPTCAARANISSPDGRPLALSPLVASQVALLQTHHAHASSR